MPEPETEPAENDAVTPEGNPVAESATLPLKLPTAEIVIVDPVALPAEVLTPVGFAEIVKSALPSTRVTVVLWLKLPLTACTVIG